MAIPGLSGAGHLFGQRPAAQDWPASPIRDYVAPITDIRVLFYGFVSSYRILNTRKRVVVALVHTVIFLGVAVLGFFFAVAPLRPSSPPSAWILAGVYTVVSSVLLWLTSISRGKVERLYFACCATSASFGLLRQLLGDPAMHAAVYVRVAMLACAVATGLWMLGRSQASVRSVSSGSTRVARRAGM